MGQQRFCSSSSSSAAELIWEPAINREGFGELNLFEFLVGLKGNELHVADSALGQGSGLDELLRSLFLDFVTQGQLC